MISIYEILKAKCRADKEALIQRLIRNTANVDGSTCIVWTGAIKSNGYGAINFRHDGKHYQLLVHRVFWVLMNKRDVPNGMHVDHKCNTRNCVRHLQAVTPEQNRAFRQTRRKDRY